MENKYYLNLTNGLEFYSTKKKFEFVRIQSTWCEQKRWNEILLDLDNNFLMNLVIGNKCIIYDASPRKKTSRALYQGIEWIKYVLYHIWFNKNYLPLVKGHNTQNYFQSEFKKIPKSTIKKIKYFKKFLLTDNISLTTICKQTKNDSKYEWFKNKLKKENKL